VTEPTIAETIMLVRGAHAGQVDLCGEPYHLHCEAVHRLLLERWPDAPPFARHAALLHDVMEDTRLTNADLLRFGYPLMTAGAVRALARPKGVAYLDWIRDTIATRASWIVRIKLADLEHNTDPERVRAVVARWSGRQPFERVERYEEAKRILNAALTS